jgi:sugar (pentulose or hexulose) kinase
VSRIKVTCGVDLGSTNIKVVAVTPDGTVVARRSRPTPRRQPGDPSIDAEHMLGVIEEMLVEVAEEQWVVAGVCAAGVGEDGVPAAPDGRALSRALAWFDPRRPAVFEQLPREVRAAARKSITGVALDAARTVVGWSWSRSDNHPVPARWIALTDYPAARWTGRHFMSDTLASRTAAWSPWTRHWLEDVVTATLGDADALGPVLPAGHIVGPLASATLSAAGVLTRDAVVVVGGHDHPIGASLVQRLHQGAVLDSMGTAEVVVGSTPELHEPLRHVDDAVSVSPGLGNRGATLLAVAELARNLSWASASDTPVKDALAGLVSGSLEVPDRAHRSELFVLGRQGGCPPNWTPGAEGTSPLERAAAALLACAANGWQLAELVGDVDEPVYAAGGWTRSPGWMAIKRSLSRRPLDILPEPEVTAVGAALIAGDAVGWSQDAATALGYR